MKPHLIVLPLTLALAILAPMAPAQDRCDMAVVARHTDPDRTPVLATTSGPRALFYSADLDVNTDGAARSYHPDDPWGTEGLALNNMGNALTRIFDAGGRDIGCEPRQGACYERWITTFEAARDANYAPAGPPSIRTGRIIPWRMDAALGHAIPCTGEGGFFISATSFIVDPSAGECEQRRYLNALEFNANVLPGGVAWRSQDVATDGGDLVALIDARTGEVAFAINGDAGPRRGIGEGSVRLAAELGRVAVPERATYREIRALKRPRVHYLIFPDRDIRRLAGRPFTQEDIDRLGAEALAAFGGTARMLACARGG